MGSYICYRVQIGFEGTRGLEGSHPPNSRFPLIFVIFPPLGTVLMELESMKLKMDIQSH